MKVVINTCYGGFGLSKAAYEKLIEWGVPVRKYEQEVRDEKTRRYKSQPSNEGEVIFDQELSPKDDIYHRYKDSDSRLFTRYWDSWTRESRTHPLTIRVVEELGDAANGPFARLKVIEIPDDTEYEISEYGGSEHIAEKHRTWG